MRNYHTAVLNTVICAQEYFRKPFHLTPSDAASRNGTWISVTQRESYTSVLHRNATEFSGPELISDILVF